VKWHATLYDDFVHEASEKVYESKASG